MKNNLLNFLVASVVAVVAFASVASAEDKQQGEAMCTTREVVVLVKSTRGVIYEEKDEDVYQAGAELKEMVNLPFKLSPLRV